MNKLEVARRLLGAALALYLDDHDPVSVHTLAHAGAEIADGLSQASGSTPMRVFRTAEAGREMSDKDFFALRGLRANAFKHYSDRNGQARKDEEIIAGFSDVNNDDLLFVGLFDFASASHFHPVESHVYQQWYVALTRPAAELPEDGEFLQKIIRLCPDLPSLPRRKQKGRLRRLIAGARADMAFMADPRVDRRPLMLGALPGV